MYTVSSYGTATFSAAAPVQRIKVPTRGVINRLAVSYIGLSSSTESESESVSDTGGQNMTVTLYDVDPSDYDSSDDEQAAVLATHAVYPSRTETDGDINSTQLQYGYQNQEDSVRGRTRDHALYLSIVPSDTTAEFDYAWSLTILVAEPAG